MKTAGNDCGGFKAPKGHLDTQMFPECEGYETDRNVVKKTVERREKKKKKSFNLREYRLAERHRFRDPSTEQVIYGPEMDNLNTTRLEIAKNWLEKKYPKVIWTIDKVKDWINEHFIGKSKISGPKDLLHDV
jgi:hypothetical protein